MPYVTSNSLYYGWKQKLFHMTINANTLRTGVFFLGGGCSAYWLLINNSFTIADKGYIYLQSVRRYVVRRPTSTQQLVHLLKHKL